MKDYKMDTKTMRSYAKFSSVSSLKIKKVNKEEPKKMAREELFSWAEKFVEDHGNDFDELINR